MLTFKQFIAESEKELTLEDFSVEELQEFMQTEEYEQLDELSKGTLASYIDKAAKKTTEHGFKAGVQAMDRINPETPKKVQAQIDKSLKRQKGITAAVKRLTKEEEQL